MISREAAKKILGIEEDVYLEPEEMADKLNITFYPYDPAEVSSQVLRFSVRLKEVFDELKVNIVPYEKSLERVPLKRRIRRVCKILINDIWYGLQVSFGKKPQNPFIHFSVIKSAMRPRRIKAGISVVALGEQVAGNLPMDNTSSFRKSSVVSILDKPKYITKESGFHEHFDTAMNLFAYHMTNIVLAVDDTEWIIYNFNASHPVYSIEENLKEHVLHALVPKIVAPIRPYRFSEFSIKKEAFDVHDNEHEWFVQGLIQSGGMLEATGLYPPGKQISDLPFRNSFYTWIGKIHLDNRNGMSYGFLAVQMPSRLSDVFDEEEARGMFGEDVVRSERDFFYWDNDLHIKLAVLGKKFYLKVPDVWVLSQRSGCDKTHMNPDKDVIKMGLVNGKMFLQAPKGIVLDNAYKPSFDTKVILAHAVGNAIIASLSTKLGLNDKFVSSFCEKGMALAHWHGYLHPSYIPEGWFVHGVKNPHVACSSPQSGMYALQGKLFSFAKASHNSLEYQGDIHVEPHHGTNLSFPTLTDLGAFLAKGDNVSVLGNKYLYLYHTE